MLSSSPWVIADELEACSYHRYGAEAARDKAARDEAALDKAARDEATRDEWHSLKKAPGVVVFADWLAQAPPITRAGNENALALLSKSNEWQAALAALAGTGEWPRMLKATIERTDGFDALAMLSKSHEWHSVPLSESPEWQAALTVPGEVTAFTRVTGGALSTWTELTDS